LLRHLFDGIDGRTEERGGCANNTRHGDDVQQTTPTWTHTKDQEGASPRVSSHTYTTLHDHRIYLPSRREPGNSARAARVAVLSISSSYFSFPLLPTLNRQERKRGRILIVFGMHIFSFSVLFNGHPGEDTLIITPPTTTGTRWLAAMVWVLDRCFGGWFGAWISLLRKEMMSGMR